ncbi:hypothetical protein LCGC14_2041180, partial [marine sediment metagenome]
MRSLNPQWYPAVSAGLVDKLGTKRHGHAYT